MNERTKKLLKTITINQAIRRLDEIKERQAGLINGNFTAVASKYGLKVRELRQAYDARSV